MVKIITTKKFGTYLADEKGRIMIYNLTENQILNINNWIRQIQKDKETVK